MGRWGRARPDALLTAALTEAPSPRGEAAAPRTDTPFAAYPEGAAPRGYPPGPPSAFPGKSPAFPLRKPSRCDRPKQGDGYPAIFFQRLCPPAALALTGAACESDAAGSVGAGRLPGAAGIVLQRRSDTALLLLGQGQRD